MPTDDVLISVSSELSSSVRARQVQASFDVPPRNTETLTWSLRLPLTERSWNVGLIVGPSGSGKTTVMRHVWGPPRQLSWGAPSVVDDFASDLSVQQIVDACSAVGFNTIPAWLRPFDVLSNGEKFRVEMARRMLVTLPDWQGLGLALVLSERLGAAYGAVGRRFRTYPAHRSLIRSFSRGPWTLKKKPGNFSSLSSRSSGVGEHGGRPCAVFEYAGSPWPDATEARALIGGKIGAGP